MDNNDNLVNGKKIYLYSVILSAIIGLVVSLSQPLVWKTKVDYLQELQAEKQQETNQKIKSLEQELEYNKNISKEIKFNLKRLMEDKFQMKYIEDNSE